MIRRTALPVALALALLAAPAGAQDFQKGLEAANRGDYATALVEWRPLAEAGSATAQASLAALYALGHGVAPDIAEAIKWYRLAAGQGLAAAQFNLGQLLSSRQAGDRRDDAEARKWYALAADQGNAEAHYKLGLLLANGAGGAQDFVGAHLHWTLAEALGFKDATRQLDSLTRLMPAAQIAEAQRRAATWMTGYERRSAEVETLRHALAERETEADRLRRLLAERQGEAAALRQTIAELDSAIAGLKMQAAEKQAAVAALSAAPPRRPPADAAASSTTAATSPDTAGTAAPAGNEETPPSPAAGQASDADGVAAYQDGDYARAFAIWRALAKAGDARAQFHLGALYYEGRGVPRDLDEARRWLGIAASNGSAAAKAMLETVE